MIDSKFDRNVVRNRCRSLIVAMAILSVSGCERAAKTTGLPVTVEVVKTKNGLEMISVPGNTFVMGSRRGEAVEAPPHPVTIDAYLIDRYEVTQAEYEKFVIGNPAKFKDPGNPIERVRWVEAALYCNARSASEGLEPCYDETTYECNFAATGYRLPTEAEWENACRAGTVDEYSFSGGEPKLAEFAWFKGNSAERTHPVGTKKPNPWGIYDMYGNVGEWCQDAFDGKFYERPSGSNPCNPTGDEARVLRGGSWNSSAQRCRSASRSGEAPGGFADACFARPDIGFRCVRRAEPRVDEPKAAGSNGESIGEVKSP